MPSAEYWIDKLQLQAHPEGGFYKETYRSKESISSKNLPYRFGGDRQFSTAIYFLLRSEDISHLHRIKSDELWYFHAGSSLTITVIYNGKLLENRLGSNPDHGDLLQTTIPANCWFGARVNESCSYVLASCSVAPGFDFNDFELAKREDLIKEYPAYQDIIETLTLS